MKRIAVFVLSYLFSEFAAAQVPSLVGTFSGVMVPIPLSAEFIDANIPEDLTYEGPEDAWGLLPIGTQSNVRVVGAFFSLNYHEAALALPFLYTRDGRGPFTHLVRLYLDNELAIWGGRIFYGLPKKRGDYLVSPQLTEIQSRGRMVLELATTAHGEFRKPSDFRSFNRVAEVLSMPILQRKANGEFIESQLDWGLTSGDFQLRPIDAGTLRFGAFEPVLPVSELNLVGIDTDKVGTFEFVSSWRLDRID